MSRREPHRRVARPTVMRRVVVVLAMLVVPLMWLGVEPAAACTCVTRSVPELVEDADVVATGRLVQRDADRQEIVYTFAGIERFRGDVPPGFEVRSAASSSVCGVTGLVVGQSYVVFMQGDEGGYSASSCGGTARAGGRLVAEVKSVTGPGTSFALPPPGAVPAPVVAAVTTWSGRLAAGLWR